VEGSGAQSILLGEAFAQKDIKERIGRWYMLLRSRQVYIELVVEALLTCLST
jgi:hypothetical protein